MYSLILMGVTKMYAAWVPVRSLQESRKFYEHSLGLTFKLQDEHWIEFDLHGTSLGLLHQEQVEPCKSHIMLQVDNLQQMHQELTKQGVRIVGKIRIEPYGKILTIEDPNGHWLELFQPSKVRQ